MTRVLHVSAQRPEMTGSGVTLGHLVRLSAQAGLDTCVVYGTPDDAPAPTGLGGARHHPLVFGKAPLDFPLPGMSDTMPYPSSRYGELDAEQRARYRDAWHEHLQRVVTTFRPDLVHTHHLWWVSAWIKAIVGAVPVVAHCHGTGLRQLAKLPHFRDEVAQGLARVDKIVVLHEAQRRVVIDQLAVDPGRVEVVGAGYDDSTFNSREVPRVSGRIVYAGKLSAAKGVPSLLSAVEALAWRREVTLHLAGSGHGDDACAIEERVRANPTIFHAHGMLAPAELASLMSSAEVFVLPSLYEGLPLVVVEAMACGCTIAATDLPGVRTLADAVLPDRWHPIGVPPLRGEDEIAPGAEAGFIAAIAAALESALDSGGTATRADLAAFTWRSLFERIRAIWTCAVVAAPRG